MEDVWKKIKSYFPGGDPELPDDYFYNPERHIGWARLYLNLTIHSRDLVENDSFNYFIVIVIILAGINVGVQSYPQTDGLLILNVVDIIILLVFAFEVVVKILAEGLAPYMYFFSKEWKWNNFDFAIVFLSLPYWGGLFGGGSLALLRLVRLMRLAKLVKKIPALNMIIEGLTGGLSSIGYIMLLLTLVFYLFGIVGVIVFGGNDPFHFRSVPVSLVTLFRCATMDAWSDVMFLNMFSCDGYDYLYVSDADRTDANRMFWCVHPKKRHVLSAAYFVSFTVICALVMLSLVIGAVTVSMNDSLSGLNDMIAENRRKEKFDKAVKEMFLAQSRMEIRARQQSHLKRESITARILSRLVSFDFMQHAVRDDVSSSESSSSSEESGHESFDESVQVPSHIDGLLLAPSSFLPFSNELNGMMPQEQLIPLITHEEGGEDEEEEEKEQEVVLSVSAGEEAKKGDPSSSPSTPSTAERPEDGSNGDASDGNLHPTESLQCDRGDCEQASTLTNELGVMGPEVVQASQEVVVKPVPIAPPQKEGVSGDGVASRRGSYDRRSSTSSAVGEGEKTGLEIERIVELRNQHHNEMHDRNQHNLKRRPSYGLFTKILEGDANASSTYGRTSHSDNISPRSISPRAETLQSSGVAGELTSSADGGETVSSSTESFMQLSSKVISADRPSVGMLNQMSTRDSSLSNSSRDMSSRGPSLGKTSKHMSSRGPSLGKTSKHMSSRGPGLGMSTRHMSIRNKALAEIGGRKKLSISAGPSRAKSPSPIQGSPIAKPPPATPEIGNRSAMATSRVRRLSTKLSKPIDMTVFDMAPEDMSFAKRPFSTFLPNSILEAMDYIEHEQARRRNELIGYKLRVALGELPESLEDGVKSFSSFRELLRQASTTRKKYRVIASYSKFISEHSRFVGFITLFIVLAGMNVGAQTDERIIGHPEIAIISHFLDRIILSVFTMEVFVKVVGEGTSPWMYFSDNWNKFDFIVVAGSYAPGAGSLLTILRLLRLLRVLKLVKSLPQLEVIVNALLMGFNSIAYIGLILFLCYYVFAILGMLLFQGNDPFHFGNLHIAMFTLFRCSTLDDWSEVMYVNMYGCDRYLGVYEDFPELCTSPRSMGIVGALYFILFIVIGAQVLLTLFIGVVTTSMEQAKESQDAEFKLVRRMKTLQRSLQLTDVQMRFFEQVFNTLDLDGGGFIEIEEIELSFSTISDLFLGIDIQGELKKADTTGEGIDLITFILIMASVPSFKFKRLLRRQIRNWVAHKRAKTNFMSNMSARLSPSKRKKPCDSEINRRFDNLLKKHQIYTSPTLKRRRSGSWVAEDEHEKKTMEVISEQERFNAKTEGDQWIERIVSKPKLYKYESLDSSNSMKRSISGSQSLSWRSNDLPSPTPSSSHDPLLLQLPGDKDQGLKSMSAAQEEISTSVLISDSAVLNTSEESNGSAVDNLACGPMLADLVLKSDLLDRDGSTGEEKQIELPSEKTIDSHTSTSQSVVTSPPKQLILIGPHVSAIPKSKLPPIEVQLKKKKKNSAKIAHDGHLISS